MEEETDAVATIEITKVRWGPRCALAFLDGVTCMLVLPMIGTAFALLVALVLSRHQEGSMLASIFSSLVILALFQMVLAMMIATAWFSQLIRIQEGIPATSRWSRSPVRIFLIPLLMTTGFFALANLTVSLVIKLFSSSSTTWGWILFWLMAGGACYRLRIWLDRIPAG